MGKENIRFFTAWILLGKIFAIFCSDPELTTNSVFASPPPPPVTTTEWLTDYTDIVSKFSLRSADIPDDDMCYIVAGRPDTIQECKFNAQTQTFVIIHGWTVTGMFESWVPKLVSALYERVPNANVIVVDWLTRANQHYSTSAAYTKLAGRDVAKFVTWIQKELQLPWDKIHLLGYSLGAHVAGIAGYLTDHKISRITGKPNMSITTYSCGYSRSGVQYTQSHNVRYNVSSFTSLRCSSKNNNKYKTNNKTTILSSAAMQILNINAALNDLKLYRNILKQTSYKR
uniref:Lipoprotein lipase a n=2 Tax=Hippocampus comes TaxID=109280 RepID=A0A3Q2YHI0_HIPCM